MGISKTTQSAVWRPHHAIISEVVDRAQDDGAVMLNPRVPLQLRRPTARPANANADFRGKTAAPEHDIGSKRLNQARRAAQAPGHHGNGAGDAPHVLDGRTLGSGTRRSIEKLSRGPVRQDSEAEPHDDEHRCGFRSQPPLGGAHAEDGTHLSVGVYPHQSPRPLNR